MFTQKRYLFFVVFLQRVVISFLEPAERDVHLGGPPDLNATQCDLSGEIKQPLFTRFVLVGGHCFRQLVTNCTAHGIQHSVQPNLHLQTSSIICIYLTIEQFLPRDAMRKRGLCCGLSVRPSVCLSVCHAGGLYRDG